MLLNLPKDVLFYYLQPYINNQVAFVHISKTLANSIKEHPFSSNRKTPLFNLFHLYFNNTPICQAYIGVSSGQILNTCIFPEMLPKTLRDINITCAKNPIGPNILTHTSLTTISLVEPHNALVPDTFPNTLRSLQLSCRRGFQANVFPSSLTELVLEQDWDVELNAFPEGLNTLFLPISFNQSLLFNMFPSSLKKLVFGWLFNQPIEENILPVNLEELVLGIMFHQPLDNLPDSLTHLEIQKLHYSHYFQSFHTLPKNLKTLCIGEPTNKKTIIANDELQESFATDEEFSRYHYPIHFSLPKSMRTLILDKPLFINKKYINPDLEYLRLQNIVFKDVHLSDKE